jgi:putative membrane protein
MATERTTDHLVWIVLAALAVLLVLPILLMTVGMMGFGMMGMPMMGGGMWGGGMWGSGTGAPGWAYFLGPLVQLLFLAVLVGGGYVVYRRVVATTETTDPALEELRLAYARGELSDEEFEDRRRRLEE